MAQPGRLVLLGHPVAHSLSPVFQNAALAAADVVVRALQYLALLPLLGLCAFAVHAPRAAAAALPRRASLVLIGVGLVAGAASLLVLAARMSGALAAALDPPTLWSVVRETDAGRARVAK